MTLIQFEDLQCPVCKRYQEEGLPGIVEEYVRPGKVKLRFVGLAFIGPDSEKALRYVLAAGEQGKLWQYADAALREPGRRELGLGDGRAAASARGRARARLDEAPEPTPTGPAVLQQANAMATEAQQREVPGTPWFYVQVGDGEPYEVRPGSFAIDGVPPDPRRRSRGLSVSAWATGARGAVVGRGCRDRRGVAGYLTYVHYRPDALDLHRRRRLRDRPGVVVRRARRDPRRAARAARVPRRARARRLGHAELARTLAAAIALARPASPATSSSCRRS